MGSHLSIDCCSSQTVAGNGSNNANSPAVKTAEFDFQGARLQKDRQESLSSQLSRATTAGTGHHTKSASLLSSAQCCDSVKLYLAMQQSVDLTDHGIENIESSLREYVRVNREHIEARRDREVAEESKQY